MGKKIVYHGTVENEPPHVHGFPFHAGSKRAAQERIDDEISHGMSVDEPTRVTASYHAYEIDDESPMSKRTWQDPMFYQDERKAVPEHKENRIYPYTNEREDRGSTSYVIPSSFVGKHVKHLGVQFKEFYDLEP